MTDDLMTLLNAYLDCELPSSQIADVEKLLAQDAQTRRVLEDLRRVRRMVAATPRRPAPAGFAEQVQIALEREALLGQEELRTETLGRNHLRLRRILTAAAMLVLVGAIVYIVYLVLYAPAGGPVNPTPIANNTPGDIKNVDDFFAAAPTKTNQTPEPEFRPVAPEMAPPQTVELAFSAADMAADRQRINSDLMAQGVDAFISTPLGNGQWQVSFVCTPQTLRALVNQWRGEDPSRLALLLPGSQGKAPVRLAGPQAEQVLLAGRYLSKVTEPMRANQGDQTPLAFVAAEEHPSNAWQNPIDNLLPDLGIEILGNAPSGHPDSRPLTKPNVQVELSEDVIAVTLTIEPAAKAITPLPPISAEPATTNDAAGEDAITAQ